MEAISTPKPTAQEKAESLMNLLCEMKAEKARLDEGMKTAKKELLALADRNKSKFTDGRWKLKNGVVRESESTEVIEKEGVYSLKKVVAKLPDAVISVKYDKSYLKRVMEDRERRKVAQECGLELSTTRDLVVEVN